MTQRVYACLTVFAFAYATVVSGIVFGMSSNENYQNLTSINICSAKTLLKLQMGRVYAATTFYFSLALTLILNAYVLVVACKRRGQVVPVGAAIQSKITNTTTKLVAIFVICILPLLLYPVIARLPVGTWWQTSSYILVNEIVYLNTATKTIIYGVSRDTFSKEMQKVARMCTVWCPSAVQPTDSSAGNASTTARGIQGQRRASRKWCVLKDVKRPSDSSSPQVNVKGLQTYSVEGKQ